MRCCEQLKLPVSSGLRLDDIRRWSSTWNMLYCNIQYSKAFIRYSFVEAEYTSCPSQEEWDLARAVTSFWRPFWKFAGLFSGSSYPTANLYVFYVFRVQEVLIENLNCEIEVVRNMAHVMLPKVQKYWDDYFVVLSMAIILDPRLKVHYLKLKLKKIGMDENVVDSKVNEILGDMKLLYSEYVLENANNSSELQVEEHNDYDDVLSEFASFAKEIQYSSTISDLELYLEEKNLPQKESFDIFQEWRKLSERFPILAKMAIDILSIPITTVASKSAFSIGAKVLNGYSSSPLPTIAEALICGRNWINDYHVDDEIADEDLTVPLVKNQES